jgi:ubiquinone/menaquinone biosynthesis C-methylase UbiE
LDVGCGSGADTIHLAELVGGRGHVVGIDYDAGMVAQANQRLLEAGLGDRVTHEQGNATSLPFTDARFDASRSERLFQHMLCPERVLFEMRRVTKPGGRVVVLDTDWGTLSINSSLPDSERRIVQYSNEYCMNNGYSGRRLLQLFSEQGLKEISIEVLPYPITDYALAREVIVLERRETEALAARVITSEELKRWHEDLEELDHKKSFFASFNVVLVKGVV